MTLASCDTTWHTVHNETTWMEKSRYCHSRGYFVHQGNIWQMLATDTNHTFWHGFADVEGLFPKWKILQRLLDFDSPVSVLMSYCCLKMSDCHQQLQDNCPIHSEKCPTVKSWKRTNVLCWISPRENTAMVPHLWLYLKYWWNEGDCSSTRISFDRV